MLWRGVHTTLHFINYKERIDGESDFETFDENTAPGTTMVEVWQMSIGHVATASLGAFSCIHNMSERLGKFRVNNKIIDSNYY